MWLSKNDQRCHVTVFEDGGRGHTPSKARKGKDTDIPQNLQKETQTWRHTLISVQWDLRQTFNLQTIRQQIYIVLCHQTWGHLLWQSQEMNTESFRSSADDIVLPPRICFLWRWHTPPPWFFMYPDGKRYSNAKPLCLPNVSKNCHHTWDAQRGPALGRQNDQGVIGASSVGNSVVTQSTHVLPHQPFCASQPLHHQGLKV